MRSTDIKIGEWYKNKENNYGFYKALEILNPGEKENDSNKIMVKCVHSAWGCNDNVGIIRYIKPSNIIK
nr:hypothetical protein [Clostridioides sp.]